MRRCAQCSGKLGLIVQQWLTRRFCSKKCKQKHLDDLKKKDDDLRRWLAYLSSGS